MDLVENQWTVIKRRCPVIETRIDFLKRRVKRKAVENSWKENELLQECIEGVEARLLIGAEAEKIEVLIQEEFPFSLGRIDFEQLSLSEEFSAIEVPVELKPFLDMDCYIMWSSLDLPLLIGELRKVLSKIDDVTAVSFDTWIVSREYQWIIQFSHGRLIYGFKK